MQTNTVARGLMDFIRRSPGRYHAVENVRQRMEAAGFTRLLEREPWQLKPGGKYYVERGGSSILSFRLPEKAPERLRLILAHSDSPTFKIKPGETITADGITRLNVEKYGGAILTTWFDRPLSVAGRVLVQESGKIVSRLVCVDRDLLMIPSLAIHLSDPKQELSVQTHLLPVLSADGSETATDDVLRECGVDPETVLASDLFVTCRMEPTIWGAHHELLSAPRLDDLACVYGAMEGFLAVEAGEDVLMHCALDNEEVGSHSKQGAASTFLRDAVDRICAAYGFDVDARAAMLARSVFISADNAHAAHPAYPAVYDPVNRPRLNGGVVLKHHAGHRYITDATSASLFRLICREHDIPMQEYTNHSDQRGGSTLGNVSNTQVSLNGMDIGLPQLAMHSAYETMGANDPAHLVRFASAFYADPIPEFV